MAKLNLLFHIHLLFVKVSWQESLRLEYFFTFVYYETCKCREYTDELIYTMLKEFKV